MINNRGSIIRGMHFEKQYKISFWDGLVLQAAERAGAAIVYSEDLSHGQSYEGIRVLNPFLI